MSIEPQRLGPASLEITIRGRLTSEDYDLFVPLVKQIIDAQGAISLLVKVSDFEGWSPKALWRDLAFDMKHYTDVARFALVAEQPRMKWLAVLAKPFTAAEVRFFEERDVEQARNWVCDGKRVGPKHETRDLHA